MLIRLSLSRCVLVASMAFFGISLSRGQDDSSAVLWRYYPPLKIGTREIGEVNGVYRPEPAVELPGDAAEDLPAEARPRYATPHSRLDPQFDSETRPSWTPETYVKPYFTRQSYDYPTFNEPLYRLEPVNKAKIDRPLYDAPDIYKPYYTREYTEGPAEVAPTLAAPDYRRPDYVIEPYRPPVERAPTVDRSGTDYHPEAYRGPVYRPDEYRPPRQLPPEYMPPPRE
ncbi:MAG: hypothetical protein IT426_03875 [Pirellulales bacterium]|nr:hypothetical protein [Pirellulales bacterium]